MANETQKQGQTVGERLRQYDLGHPGLLRRGYVCREFRENRGVIESILRIENAFDQFRINWVACQEGFCQIELYDVASARKKLGEIRRGLNSWLEDNFDSSVYMEGSIALYSNPNTHSRIQRVVLDIGSLKEIKGRAGIGQKMTENKKLYVIGCEYSGLNNFKREEIK